MYDLLEHDLVNRVEGVGVGEFLRSRVANLLTMPDVLDEMFEIPSRVFFNYMVSVFQCKRESAFLGAVYFYV
jgi:hypothetical protein